MGVIIKADELTSANEKHIAGQVVQQGKTMYQYLYVPANTEQGEVLVLSYDGDEETNPKAVAPATASFKQRVVVAGEDQGSSAGFQWCIISGECSALVDGTTDVAKDDFLEVLNTADGFTKDGTSRAATSAAIAREAQTANSDTLTSIYLIGEGNTIASS